MLEGVMHDFRQDEYRGLSCQAVLCMTFIREPENQRTTRALPVDIRYRQRPSYIPEYIGADPVQRVTDQCENGQ